MDTPNFERHNATYDRACPAGHHFPTCYPDAEEHCPVCGACGPAPAAYLVSYLTTDPDTGEGRSERVGLYRGADARERALAHAAEMRARGERALVVGG